MDPAKVKDIFDRTTIYSVPHYQRAYAWEESHLKAFLSDLQTVPAGKDYFLGTLLLQQEGQPDDSEFTETYIVDGQQRLTTCVIFVAACLSKLERSEGESASTRRRLEFLQRRYISDVGVCKFRTIKEDRSFFERFVNYVSSRPASVPINFSTPSQRRLFHARRFFDSAIEPLTPEDIMKLLQLLEDTKILYYSVNNPEEATLIFELHNDRGKKLTELEGLKSFLMHSTYLSAKSPKQPLEDIQEHFANIYRACEACTDNDAGFDEDSVLRYHCIAFEEWKSNEYSKPKDLVKALVQKQISAAGSTEERLRLTQWLLEFTRRLQDSYEIVKKLLESRNSHEMDSFADLYVLDRLASFYPLLLKTYKYDNGGAKFQRVVRLMEIFAFRGYAIANLRADAAKDELYRMAQGFSEDFPSLEAKLRNLATNWREVEQRFLEGLRNPLFYSEGRDALYLLWKYENDLRNRPSNHYPKITWGQFLDVNAKTGLSAEHIAAQEGDLPAKDDYALATIETSDETFKTHYLHSLGNLVIDSRSPNASKGTKPFPEKESSYSDAPLTSQKELKDFVVNYNKGGLPIWDADAIKKRTEHLISFAKRFWSSEVYASPDQIN